MALDPNIALGVRPIELQNPLAQYAQVAQIQGAQNQNALAQYQLSAAQRADAQANVMNELYGKHFDPTTGKLNQNALNAELIARNQAGQIPVMQAKFAEAENKAAGAAKAKADAAKAQTELIDRAKREISARPSDANITSYLEDIQTSDLFSPQQKKAAEREMKDLLAMPFAKRADILSQAGATASDYTTRRGQTMADARARERLDAEMATGTLTPASLDLAANVYLQTGQLPTGLGKSAANLRSQVMNRATELSSGKPAADLASGIVDAKIDVASRGKAVKDFSTGVQGRQVNAFNTAIDHLGTMDKLSDALANGDLKAINAVGNVIARQTGQPAPTNFDAAKQIVTAEVIKAVVASGGGVTERQEAERNFSAASSPEQLKGVINTYKQLLGGQLKSLNLQYENTTGRKDFGKKLTGEAKSVVQELRGGSEAATAAPGAVDTKNKWLK